MSTMRRPSGLVPGAALAALLLVASTAGAQPLRTDLASYFIFAMRSANLKNMDLLSACNVGVNCPNPAPNNSCGSSSLEDSFFADGSQLAADVTKFNKGGASMFQVFSNLLPNPANVTIRQPGPGPNGTNPLTLPILGDLDGDGNPSCGPACTPDFGDVGVFCGLPNPAPLCDVTKPILVTAGGDCVGAPDAQAGNAQCDLPPGTYGNLAVQNGATISFDGGTYVFCNVQMGRNVNSLVKNATTLNVTGDFAVNNGSAFGEECGDFTVNAFGVGSVSFGRNMSVTGFFCAPERNMSLGHNNDLTGRFVGDVITADSSDRGHCCGGSCACVDEFSPTTAAVGATITLTGGCSLTNVTGVRICGIVAPITFQSIDKVEVTVPVGATGMCPVEVDSAAGTFTLLTKLTVS
ncbi:MAG TPA: hypothetical protein VGR62_12840 [Candidatus Binatia bacterium]|jgi:hypothetical protein|nr:hypothetical protein [Candidatus Binatia bacterium]